ncbi:hypothetical protein BDR06DRAFT_977469 [Suillus hirtellus]|nr:hypothetical protein BDR06DRAFT_977469 [Suillus hirtellus]
MFHSNDLSKEVTIMLAWSPNLDGLYEDFFLIVWRVHKFRKLGPYWATENHTAQLATCLLQGQEWEGHQCHDLHQYQSPMQAIMQKSEKTTLTKASGIYHFSPLPRQCVCAYNYVAYSQAFRGVVSR